MTPIKQNPPTTRLTFTPGNHSYTLDGLRVPSVTTLLNLLAKPALVRWAAREAASYAIDHWDDLTAMPPSERAARIAAGPEMSRSTAAATGTQIHAWAEQLLNGTAVQVPDAYAGTVQGLSAWWAASGMTVIATETRVWSDADGVLDLCAYAGTFDILAEHPDLGRVLLDVKTGKGVWPKDGMQLAAYAGADMIVVDGTDEPMPPVDSLAVLHVRPDGTTMHLLDGVQRRIALERFDALRYLHCIGEPTLTRVIA